MHKLILTLSAILVEGFAAYEALPIVQNKFGNEAGIVFTCFIAVAIFYTWFLSFNAEVKSSRIGARLLAVLIFVPLTMVSTYQSKILPDIQAQELAAQQSNSSLNSRQLQADATYSVAMKSHAQTVADINQQWKNQESSRMDSLAQVNKEIKATKKLKQPAIYKTLLNRQAALSAPYSRATYPDKPEREIITSALNGATSVAEKSDINLTAFQSLLLSVLTPIFLWLANGLPKAKKRRGSFGASFGRWFASFSSKGHSHTDQAALVESPLEGNYECPFQARRIITGNLGQVTVSNIRKALKISDRQARKRQAEAVENGYLVKKPSGYFYPEKAPFEAVKLRAVAG